MLSKDLNIVFWQALIKPGDKVIDATCGNGHDTLILARLTSPTGELIACDIQEAAIASAKAQLALHPRSDELAPIRWVHGCHSSFPADIIPASIKLIVYNLGYLPGSDKQLTTQCSTTLQSIQAAMKIVMPQGGISITCYPGHPEGKKEEKLLVDFAAGLSPREWSCSWQRWINRERAPSLLFMIRNKM